MWKDYNEENLPTKEGYYYTLYENWNGNKYYKALWWDGKKFSYRNAVKEVFKYLDECYDFYVPCQMNGDNTPTRNEENK